MYFNLCISMEGTQRAATEGTKKKRERENVKVSFCVWMLVCAHHVLHFPKGQIICEVILLCAYIHACHYIMLVIPNTFVIVNM